MSFLPHIVVRRLSLRLVPRLLYAAHLKSSFLFFNVFKETKVLQKKYVFFFSEETSKALGSSPGFCPQGFLGFLELFLDQASAETYFLGSSIAQCDNHTHPFSLQQNVISSEA